MAIEGKKFSELTTGQKVAMRNEIRGYKVYRAKVQMGGGNPTVTVIENTCDGTAQAFWYRVSDGEVWFDSGIMSEWWVVNVRVFKISDRSLTNATFFIDIKFMGVKTIYGPDDVIILVTPADYRINDTIYIETKLYDNA